MPTQDPHWDPYEDLRSATRAGAFRLFYQPIVGAADLDLVAYESLLRWSHPERGMVAPPVFIPVAEERGLIHEIGLWVLRRACRDLSVLNSRYVGVNVSAIQLRRPEFAQIFTAIVGEERIDPPQVTVEITESVELRRGGVERRNLDRIRELGCYLAIDDFGTGYASHAYIEQFPFNVLKVDKSFVQEVATSAEAQRAVSSICEIATRRDIVIVAEGVETEEQFRVLRDLGCSRLQGYLFGRPGPVDALPDAWLSRAAMASRPSLLGDGRS